MSRVLFDLVVDVVVVTGAVVVITIVVRQHRRSVRLRDPNRNERLRAEHGVGEPGHGRLTTASRSG